MLFLGIFFLFIRVMQIVIFFLIFKYIVKTLITKNIKFKSDNIMDKTTKTKENFFNTGLYNKENDDGPIKHL